MIELAAVEHVIVAVAPRRRAHRAERVGARAGLGQSEGADGAAVAQPRQEARADVVRAVAGDVIEAQVLVRHVAERDRRIPARESLRNQTRGEEVAARAAELGRRGDAEEAHAGERRHRLRRPPFLVVHALLQRPKLRLARSGRSQRGFLPVRR